MNSQDRQRLEDARDVFADSVRRISDSALDSQRSPSEWTFKEIVAHVAHSKDFYVMMINQLRHSAFGSIKLTRDTPDYRLMVATDNAVRACVSTTQALELFEQAFLRLAGSLEALGADELTRNFTLTYEWHPAQPPVQASIASHVIEAAIGHMREHALQISERLGDRA